MNKKILIGIKAKNCADYLYGLSNQLCNLTYPHNLITVAIIENDSEDDTWSNVIGMSEKLERNGFNVFIEQKTYGYKLLPKHRHLPEVQGERLRIIGELAQYIIDKYMDGNDYLWWCDGDYTYIPPSMFEHLIGFDVDIVIPVCTLPDGRRYEIGSKKDGMCLEELQNQYRNTDLIEIDIAGGSTLISKKVIDAGVKHDSMDGLQEGIAFSLRAKEKGFKIYASLKTVYHHADINGEIPL